MKLLKRIALMFTKVLLGFFLIIALLVGALLWHSKNVEIEYKQFSTLKSSDGSHNLIIEVGNPVLAYGPHSVLITIKNASESEVIVVKKTKLSNDGAKIESHNINAQWIDIDTARVCIKGDEQKDIHMLIKVQNRTITEIEEKC